VGRGARGPPPPPPPPHPPTPNPQSPNLPLINEKIKFKYIIFFNLFMN